MATKLAPQGIVAQSFSHVDIATAAQGDIVEMAGDFEVQTSVGAGRPIGRLITIDTYTNLVVVELFSSQIIDMPNGATAMVAGNHVKAGPLVNGVACVVPGAAGDGLSWGIALNGAVATTGSNVPATVTVVAL